MGRLFGSRAGFALCWSSIVVVVLLILCSCSVPVALAQSQPGGFLNIDCGTSTTYTDPATGLTWVPDTPYITSGKTQAPALPASLQSFTELRTLRFFDDLRSKNCYALPVVAGSIYLLRATFFYANFDNANTAPSFQLAIDATILDNITAPTGDYATYAEYHYVAQGNRSYFCLVRTSSVYTPFVSGISLKPAGELSKGFATNYGAYLQKGIIMKTRNRVNFGGTELIRAPADFYDRFWFPEGPGLTPYYLTPTTSPYQFLATNSTFPDLLNTSAGRPSIVMQTAVTTSSAGTLQIYLLPKGSTVTLASAYLAIEYAELNSSTSPLPHRNFTLQVKGSNYVPVVDLSGWTFKQRGWWNIWSTGVDIGASTTLIFTPLPGSEAGPILNSIEVFDRTDPAVSKTVDRDALAIEDIKTSLNLTKWTGDPCLPSPYSWVNCSTPVPTSSPQPEIIALNLSGYQLEGAIPDSIANLWDLTTLSLDNNNLSGPIPEWISTLAALRILSVQNNNLNGTIPDALLATNSKIRFTYRPGNPLLIDGPLPCRNCDKPGKKPNVAAIVGASVGGVVGLILIVGIAIFAYRRCKRKPQLTLSDNQGDGRLKRIGAKAFTVAELNAATSDFDKKLGVGGFGPVYYGKLPGGQEVAVKVADVDSKQGEKEFFNEVDVLSRVHHKNLVALVGYCHEQNLQILVYEYMHNGSVFDHLHGETAKVGTLDWKMRLHIALNAAQGLQYLHTGCSPSFIHRDVKSSNILLTHQYDAKMADFGLTKHLDKAGDTRVMTKVTGTLGYLDPEYCSTQYLSSKSDIYSFGIVLLELITGRLPIDRSGSMGTNSNIVHWVRENLQNNNIDTILDPMVKASNPNIEGVWKVAEVAMQSVEPKGVHRPTITEVVQELLGALTLEGTSVLPPSHSQQPFGFSSGSYAPISLPTPR